MTTTTPTTTLATPPFYPLISLQDQFAPLSQCFGCGPCNERGLHIKSFVQGEHLVATWHAQAWHQAFPGVLNGGIIGALLDCHSNWMAAWSLKAQRPTPPCTVTAKYEIRLLRPTPSDPNQALHLSARVNPEVTASPSRAHVVAELRAGDQLCATCSGLFVEVQPGHPAFHRW